MQTRRSTFFGDPGDSVSHANVDAVTVAVEHVFSDTLTVRNRFRYSTVDKFYQNVFPGAVNGAGTTVSISAYNQATTRDSVINQTDLVWQFETGSVSHTVLTGIEAAAEMPARLHARNRCQWVPLVVAAAVTGSTP